MRTPEIKPSVDEVKNGWTPHSLQAYVAERLHQALESVTTKPLKLPKQQRRR